ncbi:MAG TPA: GC-type dockerin domain-anchored protein [Phycisphaerales bacterium]|nr:GC-type dockerin domain-anchored protein [Phycisphaerales bacterium]
MKSVLCACAALVALWPASSAAADPPPAPDALTEFAAPEWAAQAENSWATVTDDAGRKVVGGSSLRFETGGGFDTWLWAPGDRDASWDLLGGGAGGLAFRAYVENDFPFQNGSPWVRLHSGGGYAEFRPAYDVFNDAIGSWIEVEIPYAGDSLWSRTDVGSPDLSAVNSIEIHADTWDAGFVVWLDGLRFDLPLPAPGGVRAYAGNRSVEVEWDAYPDPMNRLTGFAIYRRLAPFDSTDGLSPIAVVNDPEATRYVDGTAQNGVRYHYAVAARFEGGAETTEVESVGPRTPWNETDLQVVSISRTPRFPRFDPTYAYYEITEPGGFGPYIFTAATGLGSGQDGTTQRWPEIGQAVAYTATIRNRGTNSVASNLPYAWTLDGGTVETGSTFALLEPGETATVAWTTAWDDADHEIGFSFTLADARAQNNAMAIGSKSVAFLSFADRTYIEKFREESRDYNAITDDLFDWLNAHMARFNEMFAAAGTGKRVHFDVLTALEDDDPDPAVDRIEFAIFPFRYRVADGTLRLSGYYDPADDLDYGLLHEMGHQLGLIDLYRLDLPAERNWVSGRAYWAIECLMHGVSHVVSNHSAGAMRQWLDKAHGYYGQYLYALPEHVRVRLLGHDGRPLAGATVRVFQRTERPGLGDVITDQVKFEGVTDSAGEWTLPNVDIDESLVPQTYAGDALADNPFGYVAVVGTNGLLLLEVTHNEATDYAWLAITEVNEAFWAGQTGTAVFEKTLALGGATQHFPPRELTEQNAAEWSAWAQDGKLTLADDFGRVVEGQASLQFSATGGADNAATYPALSNARWDLSAVEHVRVWAYAVNGNGGFQSGSPWVRLRGGDGYIELRSTSDQLNQAIGRWAELVIPIAGSSAWARTVTGSPAIDDIRAIEMHADTWGAGFAVWWDGLTFDPPVCPADFNADGAIDSRDVIAYLNAWTAEAGRADINADGVIDSRDVIAFLNEWVGGC